MCDVHAVNAMIILERNLNQFYYIVAVITL